MHLAHTSAALAVALLVTTSSARAEASTVRVHLAGGPDVALLREDPCTHQRTIVCSAPCDRDVPSTGLYEIRGESFLSTEPFELTPGPDGKVWLDVNRAPKSTYYVGVGATSVGMAFTIVGFGVVISGMAMPDKDAGNARQAVGGYMMLGGIGSAVLGGVLLAVNGSSSVRQGDASTRTPVWTKPIVPVDTPSTLHVPLAALSF